jgi:hypothetical protein
VRGRFKIQKLGLTPKDKGDGYVEQMSYTNWFNRCPGDVSELWGKATRAERHHVGKKLGKVL